jgi:hypothetical protein
MGPFVLLDDASTDQVNFAQAIEALATGDPKRVRAADPKWRKRHACDHPPCWLAEGWCADHFDAYMLLWSCMIDGKVVTTDKQGEPHSSMRYLDSSWLYADVAAGAVRGPYDERGNSMWPVHDVFKLLEDGTRVSVPDLEDLIRERLAPIRVRIVTLVRTRGVERPAAPVATPCATPVTTAPPPTPKPRRARVKKAPIEASPIKAEPPPFPRGILGGRRTIPKVIAAELWKDHAGKRPKDPSGLFLTHVEMERIFRLKHTGIRYICGREDRPSSSFDRALRLLEWSD